VSVQGFLFGPSSGNKKRGGIGMKRSLAVLVFVLSHLVLGQTCFGQAKEGKVLLPEVVVTESRMEEEKRFSTTSIRVIDEEEISLSPAKDLGELLGEKGFQIIKYPGALTSVGIRGFRTDVHGNDLLSHVLVLIDGRRVSSGNLSKILTKNVERVEIISGPASVQYGSSAMGGVINVITKRGKDKPSLFVEGTLGSWGYDNVEMGFSGKYKKLDFSSSFSTNTMDDYDTASNKRYYNTGYKRIENVSINLGYEFLPRNRLGIIYHNYNGDHIGTTDYLSTNDLDDYADKKYHSWDLTYEGKSSDKNMSWNARYFQGKDTNTWFDPVASNPDGFDDGIPTESKIKQKGGQAQFAYTVKDVALSSGFDWVNYDVESSWDPKQSEYDNPAYYLLVKSKFFDKKLTLSGGIRYDQYEVEIKGAQGQKQDTDNWAPRIGLAYQITEMFKFRANYGEAFMMPSAMQLAGNIPIWGTLYKGNPNLKPEKSKTYEFGFDVKKAAFDASITYFSTKLKDKIQQKGIAPTVVSWENMGSATIKGFEGGMNYDFGPLLNLPYEIRPYFTFTRLTEFKDDETGQDLYYTPDWTLSYGILFSHEELLCVNLSFSYLGKTNVQDWESGLWPAPIIQKGGFTVSNLVIQKELLNFKDYGRISLRGEVQNLFDTDYSYVKGYPMPGRTFFLGLKYQF